MRGKRCAGFGLLLMPSMLLPIAAFAETKPQAPTPSSLSSVVVVLDASKSMGDKDGATTKLSIARSVLVETLPTYEARLSFGLVAYGHRQPSNCADTQTLAKPGELTTKTQAKLLDNIKPKGQSPIAAAMSEAAKTTAPQDVKRDIVLVVGAGDSCKSDFCGTAELLKKKSPQMRIHVLAYDAKAMESLAPLTCIAEKSGGTFITAANADEVKQGLTTLFDIASGIPAPPETPSAPVANAAPVPNSNPETVGALSNTSSGRDPGDAGGDEIPLAAPPVPEPGASVMTPSASPGQSEIQKSVVPPSPPSTSGDAPAKTTAAAVAAPAHPVPVTFNAMLTEAGPKLQGGLTWRVYATEAGNGGRKLVSTLREAMPTTGLLPGDYLVNAAYGLSNLTKQIKVESGRSIEETFILNTGALRLSAALANSEPLPVGAVHFDILSDEEDQFGNRRTILGAAKPGLTIRLNAGAYHIVSLYGDSNATVRVDVTVEPGKVTDATVKHAAAAITFKLVQEAGGEALADTQWSVLTAAGDIVKETTGALPTHILAAGNYAVVARHGGLSYTSKFSVETGQPKQIEVVVEAGPTSAEALRAITNPEPSEVQATPGIVPGADTGAAFDGTAQPVPSGPLVNPGVLLRPQLR
ncbi:MAG TPA: VWA domain-containing protein [Methyloceanibacter sp.]|jgi:von Willebrand factor type A domain